MPHADRDTLLAVFHAALRAAQPEGKFDGLLPPPPAGRTIVLGAGKAAASMAAAFEKAWGRPCEGLVVTRYGHGAPTRTIEVVEAAHPVPDAAGLGAAERVLALARSAGPDDLVVFLVSGGASALLTLPAAGITLADKQVINRRLLASGAPIGPINTVRKALSAIKGGRLAAAASPARLVTYAISDIPGDDPSMIGSGPTVGSNPDPAEVFRILASHDVTISEEVAAAIRSSRTLEEPPTQGHPVHLLATPAMALAAAADKARALGFVPMILGDAIEGEAREVGRVMAGIAQAARRFGNPIAPPCVLLSGGETTVTVRGAGRGGRNAEFLLSLAIALQGVESVAAIACDTDGIDGSEDNSGAWFADLQTEPMRSALAGAGPFLANNDAYSFFQKLEQLVITGPTLTNVNDFRAILLR